jgi:hypothetical protein
MRTDLNKQLCERERVGHRNGFKAVRRARRFSDFGEEGENLRAQEGIRWRYRVTCSSKEFNENLKPLLGQVRKALGQRWDTFYSEFCQNFDMRSRINQHILEHLEQYCERKKILLKAGKLYLALRNGEPPIPLKDSWVQYYVDPRDGIIKANKHYLSFKQYDRKNKKKQTREREKTERWVDADHVLRQIEGVWFLFSLKDIPQGSTVIDKPQKPDLFEIRPGRLRSWEQLDDYDRRRFGEQRYFGPTVVDLFTGKAMRYDVTRLQKSQTKRYHATKRSAPRKLLAKMGLAGD